MWDIKNWYRYLSLNNIVYPIDVIVKENRIPIPLCAKTTILTKKTDWGLRSLLSERNGNQRICYLEIFWARRLPLLHIKRQVQNTVSCQRAITYICWICHSGRWGPEVCCHGPYWRRRLIWWVKRFKRYT